MQSKGPIQTSERKDEREGISKKDSEIADPNSSPSQPTRGRRDANLKAGTPLSP